MIVKCMALKMISLLCDNCVWTAFISHVYCSHLNKNPKYCSWHAIYICLFPFGIISSACLEACYWMRCLLLQWQAMCHGQCNFASEIHAYGSLNCTIFKPNKDYVGKLDEFFVNSECLPVGKRKSCNPKLLPMNIGPYHINYDSFFYIFYQNFLSSFQNKSKEKKWSSFYVFFLKWFPCWA